MHILLNVAHGNAVSYSGFSYTNSFIFVVRNILTVASFCLWNGSFLLLLECCINY